MGANQMKQILCGAAVAAVLIAPTLARAAQPGPAAHLSGPTARPYATPAAESAADSESWVTEPRKSFTARSLKIDGLVGKLTIAVTPDGPMTLDVAGTRGRVDELNVSAESGVLTIADRHTEHSVWDWHDWFNFSDHGRRNPKNLSVKLAVPKGADVDVDGLVGDATIGDTMGPLRFAAVSSDTKIGQVGSAKISLAGSGRIDVVGVSGPLDLGIAGSGKVHVGSATRVKADIAGAGDAHFGVIGGGLHLGIAGSGDATADTVNGPVKIGIAGSGSVKIANGEAKPFKVSIMGSGNVDFGGMAVDPRVTALGSGSVRLKAYSGHLSSTGNVSVMVDGKSVNVKTGNGDDFDDNDDDD